MNKISTITRKVIFKAIFEGISDYEDFLGTRNLIRISYNGDISVSDFLNRLYRLSDLPSIDRRYQTAEEEIYQHCVANDDYPADFIVDDDRFSLRNAPDEDLLKFICEVFHPEVRDETSLWQKILTTINEALSKDGYVISSCSKISGRDVYGWKKISNTLYLPFSIRHKREIGEKVIKAKISQKLREQILCAFNEFDYRASEFTETGWRNDYWVTEIILKRIERFYIPRCFNDSGNYEIANSITQFIKHTSPYCVFDAIEIFAAEIANEEFITHINALFTAAQFPFIVEDGLVIAQSLTGLTSNLNRNIEKGVKELFQVATEYYVDGRKSIAVEKLWDALERIKTVLPGKDKSQSADLLIEKMSGGDATYYDLFSTEIKCLTTIGNKFRIRHHETNKVEITSDCNFDYFYHRCAAFINLAINYI